MKKKDEILKVEDIENSENAAILDVPDYVYVSSSGKCFYPEPKTNTKSKISLEEASNRGYKPSKAYINFLKKLYKEQKKG